MRSLAEVEMATMLEVARAFGAEVAGTDVPQAAPAGPVVHWAPGRRVTRRDVLAAMRALGDEYAEAFTRGEPEFTRWAYGIAACRRRDAAAMGRRT